MALTNFILTVAGVSAVVLLMRSDVKQTATIFKRNVKQIRHWLEQESATAAEDMEKAKPKELPKDVPKAIGQIKLNVDGVSRGNPGPAGFGGVFRDSSGRWIKGFFGKLHDCSSIEAELWGLYNGLKYIIQQGLEEVQVETDCSQAAKLVSEGLLLTSP